MAMRSKWPRVAATSGLHQAVTAIVLDLSEKKKLRSDASVLDLPCGAGSMTASLWGLGFTTVASDLELNSEFYGPLSSFVQADANHRLPFASCCFDLVVSIEGIEHFENPSAFVREIERVLSPGGLGIVTTPNVDSHLSKKNNYYKGYPRYFRPKTVDLKDSGHLHPCDIVFMRGAIARANLILLEVLSHEKGGRTIRSKLFQALFARNWPAGLGNDVPFYGDNLIYLVQKRTD